MADNSGMIKIALIGGAAYLAYRQGWLSSLGLGPAAPATTTTAAGTGTSTGTPAGTTTTGTATTTGGTGTTPVNTLDSIYAAMVTAKNAAGEAGRLSVDQWGYYLNAVLPVGKVAPDPMPIFTASISGFDRSSLFDAANYWAIMAPALRSQLGLSGLGVYGGMGAMLRRRYA